LIKIIPGRLIKKLKYQQMNSLISKYVYLLIIIGTIVGMALVRGSKTVKDPGLIKGAGAHNYGPLLMAGAIDGLTVITTYCIGLIYGACEGMVLTLTFPIMEYLFPTKYCFGLRLYYVVPITYIMIVMMFI
jgi:hypothetical protein